MSANTLTRVALVGGARTPFAKAGTAFKKYSALDLSVHYVNGLLKKQKPQPGNRRRTFLGTMFVGAESIIVNGIQILVDNETDVVGRNTRQIDFSELAVGDLVDINAVLNVGGIFLAKLIRVRDGLGDEVEIGGSILILNVLKQLLKPMSGTA